MRTINTGKITKAVKELYLKANLELPDDVLKALRSAYKKENNRLAKKALKILLENAAIAKKERIPLCQDTGLAVVFAEIGQDVHIKGKGIREAVDQGIREAVKKGYLRASVVRDPLERINTKDNTPAIVHIDIMPGNKLKLIVLAKGAGAENMSTLAMLKPSDGIEGIKKFVIDTAKNAGPNPCPPVIIGVGIGGNFEMCTMLAKKALIRKVGQNSKDRKIAQIEKDLLKEINKLGIGPSGFGGKTTCLSVNIEIHPCHIAGLPVAVNIECHAHRWAEKII